MPSTAVRMGHQWQVVPFSVVWLVRLFVVDRPSCRYTYLRCAHTSGAAEQLGATHTQHPQSTPWHRCRIAHVTCRGPHGHVRRVPCCACRTKDCHGGRMCSVLVGVCKQRRCPRQSPAACPHDVRAALVAATNLPCLPATRLAHPDNDTGSKHALANQPTKKTHRGVN